MQLGEAQESQIPTLSSKILNSEQKQSKIPQHNNHKNSIINQYFTKEIEYQERKKFTAIKSTTNTVNDNKNSKEIKGVKKHK